MPQQPPDDEFTEFVHAAWPTLYRTAYLLVGEHQLAEDLVQAALAKSYASWGKIRDRNAATAYARVALVNTGSSWFRRRSWSEKPAESVPEAAGHTGEPSDRPAIMTALKALPPRQRAVVVLRFYEDLSVRDVAGALGCTEGTVKSQTHDALARLRTLLGDAVVPADLRSNS